MSFCGRCARSDGRWRRIRITCASVARGIERARAVGRRRLEVRRDEHGDLISPNTCSSGIGSRGRNRVRQLAGTLVLHMTRQRRMGSSRRQQGVAADGPEAVLPLNATPLRALRALLMQYSVCQMAAQQNPRWLRSSRQKGPGRNHGCADFVLAVRRGCHMRRWRHSQEHCKPT